MRSNRSPSPARPWTLRLVMMAVAALLVMGATADRAEASHWRGGSIWYEVDAAGKITIDMLNLYGNFIGDATIQSIPGTSAISHERLSTVGVPTTTTFATTHDRTVRQITSPSSHSAASPFDQVATFQSNARISGILNQPTSTIHLGARIVWHGPGTVSRSPRLDAPIDRIVAKATNPTNQTEWRSDLNAVHPDGLGMTYTLLSRSGDDGYGPNFQIPGFSIDPVNGRMTIAASEIQGLGVNSSNPGGDWHFRVRVADSRGGYGIRDVLLGIITTNNVPPVISAGGDRSVRYGQPLTFTVTATDPDPGHSVTLSASGLPPGATFTPGPAGNPTTGTFSFTPTADQVGQEIGVRFDATDNGSPNLLSSETIRVSVTGDNLPPRFDFVGNKSVWDVSAGGIIHFYATATDPNPGDTLTYEYTFFRRNLGETNETQDDNLQNVMFESDTGHFHWHPMTPDIGTHRVSLRVFDDGVPVLSDTTNVFVSVGPVNRSPNIDVLPSSVTVFEGQPLHLRVRAVDPDDGHVVTITADNQPQGSVLTADVVGRVSESDFNWTPPAGSVGTYSVTFAARDNGNPALTERRTVDIIVAQPNGAPTLTSVVPGAVTKDAGHTITLHGTNFDGDTTVVTLTTDVDTRLCSNVVVAQDGLSLTCVTPSMNDFASNDFLVDVTVSVTRQGNTQHATKVKGLRFKAPTAPVAHNAYHTTSEGTPRTFNLSVTNPDGGPLTFTILNQPLFGSATVVASTGAATYTPMPDFFGGTIPPDGQGTDTFLWEVCNTSGQCDTTVITMVVTVVDINPVAADVSGIKVAPGHEVDVTLLGSDRETPANDLVYTILSQPSVGSVSLVSAGRVARYSAPAGAALGPVTCTYRVTDNAGLHSPPATVTIDIVGCTSASQCASGVCTNDTCQPPRCDDGVSNGDETGVDCGGPTCGPCGDGGGCGTASDCQSGVCTGGTCQAPTCQDGVSNGAETGVDCGGPDCGPCPDGSGCSAGSDCLSQICLDGVCTTPFTDGTPCSAGFECASGFCVDGFCCDGACGDTCKACNLAGTEGTCSYLNHPVPDAVCDGIDNNCNGLTDEDFLVVPTTCGVGACQRSGVTTCVAGVAGDTCVPGNGQTEVCDGVDNDCDGLVDGLDDSLVLIPCDNQKGVCAGAMRSPTLCVDGAWQPCPASLYAGYAFPHYGQLDLCDGRDNDCDGQIDEDFVGGPTTCGLGECTSAGTLQCVLGQAQSACVPGLPSAEVCNGLDNDCNGYADINLTGGNVCPGLNTVTVACPPPVTSLTDAEAVFVDLVTPSNGAFQCRLDGQAWFDCSGDPRCSGGSGPQNCQGVRLGLSDLSTGSHTLLVRAIDPAGNFDETPAYCAWTVDTTVPDTLLLSHPDLLSQSGTASFTFGSNIDNVDTYMCALDAGTSPDPSAFAPCGEVTQYHDLGEGAHTLVAYVVSTDGVADANPIVFSWVIDFTAPDTAITTEVGAVTCDADVTFAFSSSSDDVAGFRCRLSQISPEEVNGTYGACNQGTFTAAGLADGVYAFEVAAYDIHGFQDPSPASRVFRVDTVTPDTFIDAAPQNPSTSARATFAFSASEEEVTYRCALVAGLDAAAQESDWAPCSATPSFDGLADGPHTLHVAAADLGCLVDESPATYSWVVDTTLPATAFITTPPRLVGSGETSVFTYHDPNDEEHDTFACRHNGGEWFNCDGGHHDLGILPAGEHTFMVRSCSAVSDLCVLDPEAYTWNVTVSPCPRDLDAPELSCADAQVVECVDGAGAVVPATFAPAMSDACGVAWSDWSGPEVFMPGTSLVVFTAADHNDNLSSCVTPVNVVDTTPPAITCPDPRSESTPETGCTLAVDFGEIDAADGCSGAVVTVVSDAPLAYSVGETTVRYTAVDLAGNAASCTTSVTVTDDVPPFIDCVPTATRNAEADVCHWRGAISATASDNCSADTVTLGELKSYPVGTHTVDFEATDDHDNTGTCQSELTVLDVTNPEVDCGVWDAERDRIRVSATDACGAVATALEVRCVLANGQVAAECHANADGDLVTVTGGIGAPFTLRWIARGEDPSGNVTNIVCEQPLDLDTDGDGVVDSEDNCPLVANPNQANANGSPFGDVCDPTPFVGLGTEGGGGCASGPVDAGLPLALLFALGAALWVRRRRDTEQV